MWNIIEYSRRLVLKGYLAFNVQKYMNMEIKTVTFHFSWTLKTILVKRDFGFKLR